jgi:hypothetical protein
MNNISNNLTPQEWVKILDGATSSHEPGVSKQDRQYIIFSTEGKKYAVSSPAQLNEQNSKLSLSEIVGTSKMAYAILKNSLLKSEITKPEFKELSQKIVGCTKQLIEEREAKRNQLGWKLARGVALVLSVLSSPLMIGVLFLYKLIKVERQFNQEIAELRGGIDSHHIENLLLVLEKIKKSVDGIKDFLADVKLLYLKVDDLSLSFQQIWDEDFPKDKDIKYIEIFQKDMERDLTFCRKDEGLNIDDQKKPQPLEPFKGTEKLKRGIELIEGLVKDEPDSSWFFALQLAINQTSLTSFFGRVMSAFNLEAVEKKNLRWTDLNGESYAIKACFSDNKSPPINITIERNKQTQQIEKVNVEVEGCLDIVSYKTSGSDDLHVLVPQAIHGKLNYSITLDDNRRPVISDLNYLLEEKNSIVRDEQ